MLSNDGFFAGVQTLSKSLRATGTTIPFFVLVGPEVSKTCVSRLRVTCDAVIQAPIIHNAYEGHEASWANSELLKLNIWNLTMFDQVVYLDADTLVLECVDELFDRDCSFAAAPDTFPPDKFNAGVLFVRPNAEVFEDMVSKVGTLPSYDGGDTGFLNAYFSEWFSADSSARLSFGYNAQRTVFWFTHEKNPGYWNSIQPLKIIHYSSSPKPWDLQMNQVKMGDLEWLWWRTFMGC